MSFNDAHKAAVLGQKMYDEYFAAPVKRGRGRPRKEEAKTTRTSKGFTLNMPQSIEADLADLLHRLLHERNTDASHDAAEYLLSAIKALKNSPAAHVGKTSWKDPSKDLVDWRFQVGEMPPGSYFTRDGGK